MTISKRVSKPSRRVTDCGVGGDSPARELMGVKRSRRKITAPKMEGFIVGNYDKELLMAESSHRRKQRQMRKLPPRRTQTGRTSALGHFETLPEPSHPAPVTIEGCGVAEVPPSKNTDLMKPELCPSSETAHNVSDSSMTHPQDFLLKGLADPFSDGLLVSIEPPVEMRVNLEHRLSYDLSQLPSNLLGARVPTTASPPQPLKHASAPAVHINSTPGSSPTDSTATPSSSSFTGTGPSSPPEGISSPPCQPSHTANWQCRSGVSLDLANYKSAPDTAEPLQVYPSKQEETDPPHPCITTELLGPVAAEPGGGADSVGMDRSESQAPVESDGSSQSEAAETLAVPGAADRSHTQEGEALHPIHGQQGRPSESPLQHLSQLEPLDRRSSNTAETNCAALTNYDEECIAPGNVDPLQDAFSKPSGFLSNDGSFMTNNVLGHQYSPGLTPCQNSKTSMPHPTTHTSPDWNSLSAVGVAGGTSKQPGDTQDPQNVGGGQDAARDGGYPYSMGSERPNCGSVSNVGSNEDVQTENRAAADSMTQAAVPGGGTLAAGYAYYGNPANYGHLYKCGTDVAEDPHRHTHQSQYEMGYYGESAHAGAGSEYYYYPPAPQAWNQAPTHYYPTQSNRVRSSASNSTLMMDPYIPRESGQLLDCSEVKGVYKNCRGIWAAQWTDEKGQRHTKYFNPKFYRSETDARCEAYKFKVQITHEVNLRGGVAKRRPPSQPKALRHVNRADGLGRRKSVKKILRAELHLPNDDYDKNTAEYYLACGPSTFPTTRNRRVAGPRTKAKLRNSVGASWSELSTTAQQDYYGATPSVSNAYLHQSAAHAALDPSHYTHLTDYGRPLSWPTSTDGLAWAYASNAHGASGTVVDSSVLYGSSVVDRVQSSTEAMSNCVYGPNRNVESGGGSGETTNGVNQGGSNYGVGEVSADNSQLRNVYGACFTGNYCDVSSQNNPHGQSNQPYYSSVLGQDYTSYDSLGSTDQSLANPMLSSALDASAALHHNHHQTAMPSRLASSIFCDKPPHLSDPPRTEAPSRRETMPATYADRYTTHRSPVIMQTLDPDSVTANKMGKNRSSYQNGYYNPASLSDSTQSFDFATPPLSGPSNESQQTDTEPYSQYDTNPLRETKTESLRANGYYGAYNHCAGFDATTQSSSGRLPNDTDGPNLGSASWVNSSAPLWAAGEVKYQQSPYGEPSASDANTTTAESQYTYYDSTASQIRSDTDLKSKQLRSDMTNESGDRRSVSADPFSFGPPMVGHINWQTQ